MSNGVFELRFILCLSLLAAATAASLLAPLNALAEQASSQVYKPPIFDKYPQLCDVGETDVPAVNYDKLTITGVGAVPLHGIPLSTGADCYLVHKRLSVKIRLRTII